MSVSAQRRSIVTVFGRGVSRSRFVGTENFSHGTEMFGAHGHRFELRLSSGRNEIWGVLGVDLQPGGKRSRNGYH